MNQIKNTFYNLIRQIKTEVDRQNMLLSLYSNCIVYYEFNDTVAYYVQVLQYLLQKHYFLPLCIVNFAVFLFAFSRIFNTLTAMLTIYVDI